MENSTIAVNESRQASDTDTTVPRSSGSLHLQIETLAIHLNIPMQKKEEGKCQHFSLRGYVAEMRKRDRKICSPFEITGDLSVSEAQLPPLDAPKFRWWRCKNCISEIEAESPGEENEIRSNSGRSRSVSGSKCLHVAETKRASASRSRDKKKAIVDDSPDSSDDNILLSWKRNKQKRVVVTYFGNGTGSDNVRDEEIGNPSEEAIPQQCSTQETEANIPVDNLPRNSTRIAVSKPTLSSDNIGKIVPHENIQGCSDDKNADMPEEENGSPNNGQRTVSNTFKQLPSVELRKVNETSSESDGVLDTSKVKRNGLHSLGSREVNATSSASDANLADNNQRNLQVDPGNRLQARRGRKVRSMTELMRTEVNLETDDAKEEPSSPNTMPIQSSEPDSVGCPKDKVSCLEDAGKGIKNSRKKRNMSQEDDCKLSEMGHSNMAKRSRALNEKGERSSAAIKIAEVNEADREGLQSGSENILLKGRSDKDTGVHRKKNKKVQLLDGCSHNKPCEGTSTDKSTNGYGAIGLFQSSHSASIAGNSEPHSRNNYESLLGMERDSGLCWNSNKLLASSSRMHPQYTFTRERSTKRNDVVPMQTGMKMLTFQPANDVSSKARLDLPLNSSEDAGKRVENGIIQNWPFNLPKGNKSSNPSRKDNTVPRRSNVFESGQSSRKGVIYDLNQEIQSSPSLLQKENLQFPRRMEMPRLSSKANHADVHKPSDVIKAQRNQRPKEAVEKGTSDDIPMDIVELLARKQFERGLHETKTQFTSEKNKGTAMPYPEAQSAGAVTWLNPGVTSFHPLHVNRNADVGASRGNSLHRSHVKVHNLEASQVPEPQFKLFGTFPQRQQQISNGAQVSASAPTRSRLQHSEGSKPVWFPNVQNMPFGLGTPQKCVTQTNNKMIYGQASGSLQQGRTISDIKSEDLKRQNESHLLIPKAGNPVSSKGMGSLDPYSNETIPAMQLLSLMDRKKSSTPAFNLDTNKVLEKPFAPCNYHPPIHMNFDGSILSHHQLKESSGVHTGGFSVGQSSRQPFPSVDDQVSFKYQGQEKTRKSSAPVRLGGNKLQSSLSSRGLLRTTRDSGPGKDEPRGIVGTSSSIVLPLQDHNASKSLDLEGRSTPVTALPVKSIPDIDGDCIFNQNPADITLLNEENPYFRTAEDQRIVNASLKGKSPAVDLVGRKRRRIAKEKSERLPTGRLPPQCRAS